MLPEEINSLSKRLTITATIVGSLLIGKHYCKSNPVKTDYKKVHNQDIIYTKINTSNYEINKIAELK